MSKYIVLVFIIMSFSAHAVCTPTPDCASIGYTQTSCETKSVKCPFDTSKLFCLPCDTKYQYSCIGDYIDFGEGDSCGGKYMSCACIAGANFSEGECICDTTCKVGAIYYSDSTCSSCLEPNKIPVGVIIKDNELILSTIDTVMSWSSGYDDIGEITNRPSNAEARADYAGFANTQAIVNTYGSSATNVAGVYCYNYAPQEMENTKGRWYLLSAGELFDYVYLNSTTLLDTYVHKLGWSSFNFYFWSSSESYGNYAWHMWTTTGSLEYAKTKTYSYHVSCALSIK